MKISAGGGIRTAELRVVRCLISAGQALNASERRRQERAPCWRGCPFAWPLYLIKNGQPRYKCAAGRSEKPLHGRFWPRIFKFYLRALSVIACVQAPLGLAVITGSDPPAIKVATVRS